jgi:hypothetical protein
MKKQLVIAIISGIFLLTLLLIIKPSFTGFAVYSEDSNEKIKLGYCPTMQEEAISLSEKNNYELVKFDYAIDVLSALKNKQIDNALIGRKAKLSEINKNTKETILKSGYTLVSKKGGFIDSSQLANYEIYTPLSESIAENLLPGYSKIIYLTKEEAIERISMGKIVLISWEDWNDNYELIVVMKDNEKVKDFRGAFLYEN